MKKRKFERYLAKQACAFLRYGKGHDVWYNTKNFKTSTIPRDSEIDEWLTTKICKDLQVDPPNK